MRSRIRSAHLARSVGGIQAGTRSSITPSTSRAETVRRRLVEVTTRIGVRPLPDPPPFPPSVMRSYEYHLRRAHGVVGGPLVRETSVRTAQGDGVRCWGAVARNIYGGPGIYTDRVSKHLVDIDDDALGTAQAELRTETIKETVNEALRLAGAARHPRVKRALDILAGADLVERDEAWR